LVEGDEGQCRVYFLVPDARCVIEIDSLISIYFEGFCQFPRHLWARRKVIQPPLPSPLFSAPKKTKKKKGGEDPQWDIVKS